MAHVGFWISTNVMISFSKNRCCVCPWTTFFSWPFTSSSQKRAHTSDVRGVCYPEVKPPVWSSLSAEALMIGSIAAFCQDSIWWDFFCLGFIRCWWQRTREGPRTSSRYQPLWLTSAPPDVSEVMLSLTGGLSVLNLCVQDHFHASVTRPF